MAGDMVKQPDYSKGWICGACGSPNGPYTSRCRNCHRDRAQAENVESSGLFGEIHVAPDPASVISALAWRTLSEEERDWLSAGFYLVGGPIAAADRKTTREEIELLQRSVAEIARGTPSYLVGQAALRFLHEQRVADHFFTETPLPPEDAAQRIEAAVAGARSVIAKLPEDDRHHFGGALLLTATSVMDTRGSTRADHLAAADVFDATAEALGIDPGADLAWIEAHRPGGEARSTSALLVGAAWLVSAALMGYFAVPLYLASGDRLWYIATAGISFYLGGRIALLQFGFAGLAPSSARQAAMTALWNGLLAISRYFGVPTDPLAASVLWGILLVAWQGYEIAQGLTHEAYVGATVAAGAAAVLSYVARGQVGSPKPAPPPPPAPSASSTEESRGTPGQQPTPLAPTGPEVTAAEPQSYIEQYRGVPWAQPAPPPAEEAQPDQGAPWWFIAGLVLAGLAMLGALAWAFLNM